MNKNPWRQINEEKFFRRDRAEQERFLEARGWVRLTERADLWFQSRAEGDEIYSVWRFEAALYDALVRENALRRKARRRACGIHYHWPRPAAPRPAVQGDKE